MGNCCKKDGVIQFAFNNRDIYMRNINWNNVDDSVPMLSFKGERIYCKVVSVYDGDTIKLVFPIIGSGSTKLYKWNCRINGVDTPELRTNNSIEKEYAMKEFQNLLEKDFGYKVRDKLREKILGKVVYAACDKFDKYGRLLVNIYIDGVDISKWLIDNEYAFKYNGGKKRDWGEFLENKQKSKKGYHSDTEVNDDFKDDVEDEVVV